MRTTVLSPYSALRGRVCSRLHARSAAIASAVYTLNISILVVLLYSWRIGANANRHAALQDVYYGVQIAYLTIIGTQLFMIALSVLLLAAIFKENAGLVVPWITGFITFMALEAMAMVYSNVLRDHVNKQFDALCKMEVAFFTSRAAINCLAIYGVIRFYNLLRAGASWKSPECVEL
ncbi:uncharacterized protein LOC126281604 isoform X1 [Schistocerca gregaria]|uniref:uncharacterized protein LOC126281604 isoform X1 n=1 Tax=Schistocerca gregaria TaxID=7010 RepID=UPI00211E672E|nr:uncharacterized protein LOC126281604 isoform X1 [Schistocerca gregaria]XP_049836667.1 uncharacterized protein LOC126281604 isoform X1 [Schistocerca gregaria]